MSRSETISLINLLNKDLTIPSYQRPYEWNKSNVYVLLEDIIKNYKEKSDINLGTIILYKKINNNNFEIVDGQQRIITLSLLLKSLDSNININILNEEILCVSNTEEKILSNYYSINDFINKLEKIDNLDKAKLYNYLKLRVKFFLLESSSSQESFQLFDGRNSKYKDLTPIDLLKAFHLGELPQDYPIERKVELLSVWKSNMESYFKIDESINKNEYLFNNMLFNIYNWSLNKSITKFTKNDIYLYKGYNQFYKYEYVKYYESNDNEKFQINKPFKSGEGFFKMVNHYIDMVDKIIEKYDLRKNIELSPDLYKYNFKYINYLYYNALLSFYDKFGEDISNFYKEVVLDFIFRWSLTHRINNRLVNIDTINHYVLTTNFNFFFECNNALKIEELFKMEVENIVNIPNESEKLGKLRRMLWKKLNYTLD